MTKLYGLFSEKQRNANNKYFIYLDKNNKKVIVSEVSINCKKNENFDDCFVLGEVIKFVRSFDCQGFNIRDLKLICE